MAGKFEGVDFYDVDSLLSEEERMIRDTVREWVEDRLMPLIGKAYIERRFPKEIIPELGELGMLGANLPEEYGCAGLNNVAYGLINQELERGDSGVRSFASVQGALVMYPIYAFGSEEQKQEWLPKLASAEKIGCFGLTEPDYGSNPAGMITTAKKTDDGWLLNGTKMWITNGSMADVAIIWAMMSSRPLGSRRASRIRSSRIASNSARAARNRPQGLHRPRLVRRGARKARAPVALPVMKQIRSHPVPRKIPSCWPRGKTRMREVPRWSCTNRWKERPFFL